MKKRFVCFLLTLVLLVSLVPATALTYARRASINTCINTYHTLMNAGAEYRADLHQVHELIKREELSFPLLGKKRAMMARLIVDAPAVYRPIYSFYRRFFQKNVYS